MGLHRVREGLGGNETEANVREYLLCTGDTCRDGGWVPKQMGLLGGGGLELERALGGRDVVGSILRLQKRYLIDVVQDI